MLVTVAASKGGVGKTTLSYELAAALDAVLVDLDWDSGGATRMWGDDPGKRRSSPLLDAFERGTGHLPRSRARAGQPTLVPSSPDLGASRIPADIVADCLQDWARIWAPRAVVVDTHPGANDLTEGGLLAADLVVIPVVLGVRELDALEGMLAEFGDYRLALVPSMVPLVPPARLVQRLAKLAVNADVSVLPMISEHRWIRRRMRRRAIVAEPTPGQQVHKAATEYRAVADAVLTLATGYTKEVAIQ